MAKKKKEEKLVDIDKKFDWIERDKDFVFRNEDRSGWEKSHRSSTDYILKGNIPLSPEKEVKELYQLCRNRGNNLSPEGVHSNIVFSPKEDTGRTNGKKVFISTRVLDDKTKSFSEKADILLGLTTHEMAHVRSTDFPLMKRKIKNKFNHTIWNILEDERIEREIGEDYPGYSSNIASVKKYFFEERYLIEKAAAKKMMPAAPEPEDEEEDKGLVTTATGKRIPKSLIAEEEEDIEDILTTPTTTEEQRALELFDLLFKFVRYPKNIDQSLLDKYEVEMEEINDMLMPYPKTAKEVVEKSIEVTKYIKKKLSEDDDETGEEPDEAEIEKALEKISTMMDEELDASPEDDGEGKVSENCVKYDYKEEWIEDKDYAAVFRTGKPDQPTYEAYLNEVRGDASRLAQVLWTKVFNETKKLYGMQNGDLDDNKIVEAVHGVKTVHTTKIPRKDKKVNIVVLIDESGSMHGSKSRDAARMAVLIEQAYKVFPVGQLFIYGFTSDHGEDFNTIYRYREPGLDVRYGLGSVQGRSNNRDGHAIRAVAKRVRKFTQEPMLYFILSDGQPAGDRYYGTGAVKDTAAAVKEVSRMKFYPIQIGIQVDESVQHQMFSNHINYSSSRQMVDGIRKLLLQQAHRFVGI
jgi:hypothetical protein